MLAHEGFEETGTWDPVVTAETVVTDGAEYTYTFPALKYTLAYDANGGTIDSKPAVTNTELSAGKVSLWQWTENEDGTFKSTGTLPDGFGENTSKVPKHDNATVAGESVPVVFIGWTEEPARDELGKVDSSKIYAAGEALPVLKKSVEIGADGKVVYAVWGYDEYGQGGEGGDGIPDAQQIVVTPADITIYSGGSGYEGIVESESTGEAVGDQANGMPEPGYYFILPAALNDELRAEGETGTVNLAEDLQFVSSDRKWTLNLYNPSSTSMAYTRYVYSMTPTGSDGQDPVRLLIQGESGPVVSDVFDIGLNNLYRSYPMRLYTGAVETASVQAQIKGDNDEWTNVDSNIVKGVALGDGTLTIRGTNDTNPVSEIKSNVTEAVTQITATDNDGITYYVNGSQIPVLDQGSVQLLADSIVGENDETQTTLENAIVEAASADEDVTITNDYNFEFSYLDLVDTSNGNAYVTTGGDEVTLYWPYPEGMDQDDTFYIAHFDGLDREFDGDVADEIANNDDVNLYIYHEGDATYELETTEFGIKFTTSSFSPFALVYDASQADDGDDNPPYYPWHPDGDDDGPSGLNTEDHFSYVVGYAEDYRTGEATDDEDLWPVKPNNQITRAEVATIFYRLLEDEVRDEYDTTTNDFSDVTADSWYNQTVSTLARMGIVKGYEDGSFRPNAPITRAEFGAIATRFFAETGATYVPGTFTDVTGDEWYANAIQDAVNLGLIGGYPDGTVRPNNNITRAEACAIVNRTLGRVPDADHLLPEDVMKVWPDNNPTDWFYADMQEATNGHEYAWIEEDGHEIEEWTNLLDKDWTDR